MTCTGYGLSGARGGWVEVHFNLGLGFDGFVVKVGGLVAPFLDSPGDVREKGQRSVKRLYLSNVAVLIDGGFDRDGAVGTGSLRDLGIDARGEFAHGDFIVTPPQPSFARDALTRNSNRTLDVHGDRSSSNYALAG